jgi:hypothetical protein
MMAATKKATLLMSRCTVKGIPPELIYKGGPNQVVKIF